MFVRNLHERKNRLGAQAIHLQKVTWSLVASSLL